LVTLYISSISIVILTSNIATSNSAKNPAWPSDASMKEASPTEYHLKVILYIFLSQMWKFYIQSYLPHSTQETSDSPDHDQGCKNFVRRRPSNHQRNINWLFLSIYLSGHHCYGAKLYLAAMNSLTLLTIKSVLHWVGRLTTW
jgi:hypothetical protein